MSPIARKAGSLGGLMLLILLSPLGCPGLQAPQGNEDAAQSALDPSSPGDSLSPAGSSWLSAPTNPRPVGRVDGSAVDLSWSTVPGATHYALYAGTDPDPPFVINIATTTYTLRTLVPCATYHWRVVAHAGNASISSDLWTFETACGAKLPQAVRYPAPAHGEFGTPMDLSLSWQPVPDADTYEVYFGFDSNPKYAGSTAEPYFDRLPALREGARYNWRVVSRNKEGTATSLIWSFTVTETPKGPPTPLMLFPPDSSRELPTLFRLEWTASRDALGYEVYLGASPDSLTLLAATEVPGLELTDELELGRMYFWQVVARGADADTAGPVQSFTTSATPQPPSAPDDPSPANGAFDVSASRGLAWRTSPNADAYEVYLGTDSLREHVGTVAEPSFVPSPPLEPARIYTWQIVATNSHGRTAGAVWRFTTGTAGGGGGGFGGDGAGGDGFGGGGGGGGDLGAFNGDCGLTLASVSYSGGAGDASDSYPALTADGGIVAFASHASNLVPGDTNQSFDVFVRDRNAQWTTRVSVTSNGGQGRADSTAPAISDDGRFVAFQSKANLDANDENSFNDIYVHDRVTGSTRCLTPGSNGHSQLPAISGNGRYVAFMSRASNLIPGDTNGASDIFAFDLVGGGIERITNSPGGGPTDGDVLGDISVSADGRYVAFSCYAQNMPTGGRPGAANVYVFDRNTNATVFAGLPAYPSILASLTSDGQTVAFMAKADEDPLFQVYVRSVFGGGAQRVSTSILGGGSHGVNYTPTISGDGQYVSWSSMATDLGLDIDGRYANLVRQNLATGARIVVSRGFDMLPGNNFSSTSALSEDGHTAAFASGASNLIPNVGGGQRVYVADCLP